MRKQADQLIFAATDLSNFINCKHLTTLNKEAAMGMRKKPVRTNRVIQLLQEKGLAFEKEHLEKLTIEDKSIFIVDQQDKEAEAKTLGAMRDGIDIIYQALLKDGRWQGWADFLVKIDKPSDLGNHSYEVWDTKLATDTKAGTLMQIALYSEIVGSVQGDLPEYMYVKKPDGVEQFRVDDFLAYVRLIKKQFLEAIEHNNSTYPDPEVTCDVCAWWETCNHQRRADDHLAFIAGMGKSQIKEVRKHNINTLDGMAGLALPITFVPSRGSISTYEKLREQARLQKQSREEKRPVYELLPRNGKFGFYQLPEPSEWDVYLDLEGDPLVEDGGREYIFGWYHRSEYHIIWAEDAATEKKGFEQFMDFVFNQKQAHNDMHIYHFGSYEPSAFKRIMSRYATKEYEMDCLLRSKCFVDLHTIIKQAIRAGVERYSLKDLEKYHGYLREMDLRTLSGYKAEYEFLLETGKCEDATEEMRNAIQLYNQDDCISTQSLHTWLEQERKELIDKGENISRPVVPDGEAGEKVTEHLLRIKTIFEKLMVDVPVSEEERGPQHQAQYILAHFLDWYRREEKSFWWEYFRLSTMDADDLLNERLALTGLTYTGEFFDEKRSKVYTYSYPPQEMDLKLEMAVKDRDNKGAGTIFSINNINNKVQIKKGPSLLGVHHDTVFNLEKFSTAAKENKIIELAKWVADHGIESDLPEYLAARDILLRRNPRTTVPITNTADEVIKAINWSGKLDNSYLPIQGPPGAGKSYTGSHIIIELVKQNKRVGITALSHKVIEALIEKVYELGVKEGLMLSIVQKVSAEDKSTKPWATTHSNNELKDGINKFNVIAGTTFLWADQALHGSIDFLIIDEAGQLSLIDTLAVSSVASNVILLGDPQQLQQPQQGVHPPGTEVSALQHIVGKVKTISAEQGVFLSHTRRMHPTICSFDSEMFYEGKLGATTNLINQRIEGSGGFDGSGLFFVPVNHEGNTNESSEEIDVVSAIVKELTGGNVTWYDENNISHLVTNQDIKIITPYNAQAAGLREQISDVAVGTVDKFQGQEAPIIIFSMATSTPQDAPRGMEFLYSPNRFNVAVSRARAIFIMVANRLLLQADCKSPSQMKLANAFCRFVEVAKEVDTKQIFL